MDSNNIDIINPDLTDFVNIQDEPNLANVVKDLSTRIEQLEIQNDTTQINLNILQQILNILSEFPAGKQIINRAINRYKLLKLTDDILPRRQETLKNLKDDATIPSNIKNSFIKKEISLINTTNHAIKRRQRFERTAAKNVNFIFSKINDFLAKHKKHLSPVMMIGKD
jgi:hypothetical protein